jgi:UDP-N-acetylglucosamine 1-carboxyvinyltransferase
MDKLIVRGGVKLNGVVKVSQAKNSTLKLLAASLLSDQNIVLNNLPDLFDLKTMKKLLQELGVSLTENEKSLVINASSLKSTKATYDIVKTMRASILVLGPLLSRFGSATVSLPGGCAIGARPIDIHLKGLQQMGATIDLQEGYVHAQCDQLKGAHILLPFPSVGATENLLMAAVFAQGMTIIENAAKEPEIFDLAAFLLEIFPNLKITGAGTTRMEIHGVPKKNSAKAITFSAMGDRIEAATLIIAAVMTCSEVRVEGFRPEYLEAVLIILKEMGALFDRGDDWIQVYTHKGLKAGIIDTAPYPGFPTDVQAQLMSLMLCATGTSIITEHIFENRFMHVPELMRMGAKITLKASSAFIEGASALKGAPVMCTDLRASAALLLAALVAEGESEILRIYHLDRGYEAIDVKLASLGAQITRVK